MQRSCFLVATGRAEFVDTTEYALAILNKNFVNAPPWPLTSTLVPLTLYLLTMLSNSTKTSARHFYS